MIGVVGKPAETPLSQVDAEALLERACGVVPFRHLIMAVSGWGTSAGYRLEARIKMDARGRHTIALELHEQGKEDCKCQE